MGKRSRLRTQGVGRRRLVFLIVLLVGVAAIWAWLEDERTLLLWEQAGKALNIGKKQTATDQEITRGTIYDRNYKEFAISYERVSVYANIREIEDVNQVIGPLSAILETSESDLYDRMGKGRLRVWLAKDISQDQEDEIRKLDFLGVHLHREYIRFYPQRESAAHLIGFVERDTGLYGIEQYLNKLEGRVRLKKDDTHDLLKMGDTRPGVDGRHLILTLDSKIQRILDDYLTRLSASNPGNSYGALVMDASTGGLVGYTQIPSFDPNNFHSYSEVNFTDLFNERIAVPEVFKIFLRDLSLLESQGTTAAERLPWSIGAEMRKLGVQHISTSPHHHQSNGLAEGYVRIVKSLLHKAKEEGEDPHVALSIYRATPLNQDLPSPFELLHGRKPPSDLPQVVKVPESATKKLDDLRKADKHQEQVDENILPPGTNVMFLTPPSKIWQRAVVVEYKGYRSYKIRAKNGAVYIRTRYHLKPYKPTIPKVAAEQQETANPMRTSGRTVRPPEKLNL